MKLAQKHAKRIASLFNAIQVAERYWQQAIKEKNEDDMALWRNSLIRHHTSLREEYGIELPGGQVFINQPLAKIL